MTLALRGRTFWAVNVAPVLAASLLIACASGGQRGTPHGEPPGGSPALQQFVVAVELLPSMAPQGSRSQLGEVLNLLSAALRDQARGNADQIAGAERIEALARQLQDRTPSVLPPEIVAAALREAVRALEQQAPGRARPDVEQAHASLGAFDTSRPVLAQIGIVRSVLGSVADGLLEAAGLEPVVRAPEATRTGAAGSPPRGPVTVEAAHRASGVVSRLAMARSSEFRPALGDALAAFAEVLSRTRVDGDRSRMDKLVDEVRQDATKVLRLDQLGPDAAPAAKAGLGAALDGIEALTRPLECSVCSDWIARARATVDAIDDHSLLVFQRGPVQEACRLIADVLVISTDPAWRGRS